MIEANLSDRNYPDTRYLPNDASAEQIAHALRAFLRLANLIKANVYRGCTAKRLDLALIALCWRLNHLFGDRQFGGWEAHHMRSAEHLLSTLSSKVADARRRGWRGFPKVPDIFF